MVMLNALMELSDVEIFKFLRLTSKPSPDQQKYAGSMTGHFLTHKALHEYLINYGESGSQPRMHCLLLLSLPTDRFIASIRKGWNAKQEKIDDIGMSDYDGNETGSIDDTEMADYDGSETECIHGPPSDPSEHVMDIENSEKPPWNLLAMYASNLMSIKSPFLRATLKRMIGEIKAVEAMQAAQILTTMQS